MYRATKSINIKRLFDIIRMSIRRVKIWHTYVMESEKVLIYETMEGVYDPNSWKELASWAPEENDPDSNDYISFLRKNRV